MKEISLREMQQLELALLLELDRVCKAHGLRFYLDGGTLLGAVCYDGFIPWDDDIDVKMPRPDYDRLLTMQKDFPAHIELYAPSRARCDYAFLKLVDRRTCLEEYSQGRVKTTGVYIDILPMDAHPADPARCEKHLAALRRYSNLFHAAQSGFQQYKQSGSLKLRLKGRLYSRIYTPWSLLRKLTRRARRYAYEEAACVGLLIDGDPIRERFEKAWLEPPVMMEFEGHRFPAPNAAEEHLSIFYQKPISRSLYYHKLPKLPSGHRHRVYWKEQVCRD